ncbi:MAG: hypothetical protein ACYDDF_03895 [Thermoplasmatota archaeon]
MAQIPIVLFGQTRSPRVTGLLSIPRLHKVANFQFLVDTGADQTTLSAQLLRAKPSTLGAPTKATLGAGGKASRWKAKDVTLRTLIGGRLEDITPPEVFVLEDSPIHLLGRDVLDLHGGMDLFISPRNNVAYLDVPGISVSVPVTPPTFPTPPANTPALPAPDQS